MGGLKSQGQLYIKMAHSINMINESSTALLDDEKCGLYSRIGLPIGGQHQINRICDTILL